MAQGDVHITDDGKIALDGDGNVLLHDANDECPECCCPLFGRAGESVVVSFRNGVQCDGCYSWGDDWESQGHAAELNGNSFEIDYAETHFGIAFYRGTFATEGSPFYKSYFSEDGLCDGGIDDNYQHDEFVIEVEFNYGTCYVESVIVYFNPGIGSTEMYPFSAEGEYYEEGLELGEYLRNHPDYPCGENIFVNFLTVSMEAKVELP